MKGSLTGIVASLKWGYNPAATINGYRITRDGGIYRLTATVVLSDAFNLRQRPLLFVAPFRWQDRTLEWRGPVLDWELRAGELTARLGSLEVSDGSLSVRPPGDRALVAV